MKGIEHGSRKHMYLLSSHVKASISCNGNKGVANYIMGSYAFIAMNTK
jgi:hypothetical protein